MTSMDVPALAASTATWIFILIPLLLIWAFALVDIMRRNIPRSTKAGWAVIVLLLPFIGTLVYFLLRKPTEDEIRSSRDASGEPRSQLRGIEERRPPVE